MANSKAKTIKLLLEDGNLKGLISIADSSWNSGELYSAPRASVDKLIESEACSKYGVYLLISEDMVYVGQAKDLSKRIKQHIIGKDWWDRVVVLTTSDDSLNRSDIDYLESVLIDKAQKNNKLDCDNKNKGNDPKVSKFRKVELEQYLEEALFLIELIGISVFEEGSTNKKNKDSNTLIPSISTISNRQMEIRAKSEAKRFLQENGIEVGKNCNYSKAQENRNEFWLNPKNEVVEEDWELILNNQFESTLYYLSIPAYTFKKSVNGSEGFISRPDKPYCIDLNIDLDTFVDRRSKYRFKEYIKKIINY